jgi:hypothetical protein
MKLLHHCGVAMSLAFILHVSTGVTQDSRVKTRHLIDPLLSAAVLFANRAFFDFDPNHKVLQFWYETPSACQLRRSSRRDGKCLEWQFAVSMHIFFVSQLSGDCDIERFRGLILWK